MERKYFYLNGHRKNMDPFSTDELKYDGHIKIRYIDWFEGLEIWDTCNDVD